MWPQVTADKQDALRLNEALLTEHEELQHFMAQETSRHHNAEVMHPVANTLHTDNHRDTAIDKLPLERAASFSTEAVCNKMSVGLHAALIKAYFSILIHWPCLFCCQLLYFTTIALQALQTLNPEYSP